MSEPDPSLLPTQTIISLKGNVETLARHVERLAVEVGKVGELTERQQLVDARSADAVEKAAAALDLANTVDGKVMPRDQIEQRWREQNQQMLDVTRRLTISAARTAMVSAAVALVIALVFSGVVYFVSRHEVSRATKSAKAAAASLRSTVVLTTGACEQRVQISKGNITLYTQGLADEDKLPVADQDPILRNILQTLLQSSVKGANVKC